VKEGSEGRKKWKEVKEGSEVKGSEVKDVKKGSEGR
jgi:hypothetical protein